VVTGVETLKEPKEVFFFLYNIVVVGSLLRVMLGEKEKKKLVALMRKRQIFSGPPLLSILVLPSPSPTIHCIMCNPVYAAE
jgi:hypothetical protein